MLARENARFLVILRGLGQKLCNALRSSVQPFIITVASMYYSVLFQL